MIQCGWMVRAGRGGGWGMNRFEVEISLTHFHSCFTYLLPLTQPVARKQLLLFSVAIFSPGRQFLTSIWFTSGAARAPASVRVRDRSLARTFLIRHNNNTRAAILIYVLLHLKTCHSQMSQVVRDSYALTRVEPIDLPIVKQTRIASLETMLLFEKDKIQWRWNSVAEEKEWGELTEVAKKKSARGSLLKKESLSEGLRSSPRSLFTRVSYVTTTLRLFEGKIAFALIDL